MTPRIPQSNDKDKPLNTGFVEIYIREDGRLAFTALNKDSTGIFKAIQEKSGPDEPDIYCG